MAYIGSKPNDTRQLARREFSYAVTVASTTTFTGSDAGGKTLSYQPGELEVYMNGVRLDPADYTATTGSSVVLGSGANIGDNINIFAGQILPTDDYVSKAAGGTMTGNLTVQGTVAATAVTGDGSGLTGTGSPSIDDNGNATAITIDSSERVMLGVTTPFTNPYSTNDGVTFGGTYTWTQVSDAGGQYVQRQNDGKFFTFQKGTAAGSVGSIGTVSNTVGIHGAGSGDDAVGLLFVESGTGQRIVPCQENFASNNGIVNLGWSTNRFKDAYLSGGVYLGGTAAANKLDDYEEGTFTAGVETGTIGGGDGVYVKVGDMVYCGFTIGNFSNTSSGNAIVFNGLPFTSHSTNHGSNGSIFCRYISGGFPDASQVNTSATTGRMWKSGSTGWASVNHNDITSGTNAYFFVSLTYRAA
jgi:hypothetical protein